MSTRDSLRERISRQLGIHVCHGAVAASPAPSATRFGSTAFVGLSRTDLVGNNLTLTEGTYADLDRIVQGYDDVNFAVDLRNTLGGAPTAAQKFEVYRRFTKTQLDAEIADACRAYRSLLLDIKTDRTLWIKGSMSAPVVTNAGTSGTTTYKYLIVATRNSIDYAVGAVGSTTTGHATLSVTNYNTLTWSVVADATGYKVYRVFGGSAQGLIKTITSGATVTYNDNAADTPDGAPDPSMYEYDIPSGFSFIRKLVIETQDNLFDYEIPDLDWNLVVVKTTPRIVFNNSISGYNGYRLELQGHAYPTVLTTDTATTNIPDHFIVALACYKLGLQFPIGSADMEGWTMRTNEWKAQALTVEKRVTLPGSRKVPGVY